jgi:hypothetical protein
MSDTAYFVIDQGSDWNIQIVLQNDDGTPMNLVGCQAYLQVRSMPQSTTALIDLSTVAGTMTLNGAASQINWNVPASQTAGFLPQPGVALGAAPNQNIVPFGCFDLLIKWPNGHVTPYLSGQISLKLGVTRLL